MRNNIVGGYLSRAYRRALQRRGAAKRRDFQKMFFAGYMFGRYEVPMLERRAAARERKRRARAKRARRARR